MSQVKVRKKSRLKLLHQYYSYTGFYSFLGNSLLKSLMPIILFIAALVLIHFFVYDINDLLTKMTNTFPVWGILSVFFVSETILGLIPPDIFIAWSGQTSSPILYLSVLAVLSYFGGIIAYYIGRGISRIPSVNNYLNVKMVKHIKNTRKWGGLLIVAGALVPIPFSITTLAAGIINYSAKGVWLFGLFRFLRFYLYAIAIFSVIN